MKTQIILTIKEQPSLPVEAENIIPENFKGKCLKEIYNIPLLLGNREMKIEDFFKAEIREKDGGKTGNSVNLFLNGDLARFKNLGWGMAEGKMIIEGSVGFHAGTAMRAGTLVINGNAGDWLGAHMVGGEISVSGSAGHFIGAGWRGKKQGMTGGTIFIKGGAGRAVGARMKGGLLVVGGACEEVLGYGMLNGTIVVGGDAGIRIGSNMKKGMIILLKPAELLPVFHYNCAYEPTFWKVLCKDLKSRGFALAQSSEAAAFKLYQGDANEKGKGEVLVRRLH